MSTPKVLNYKEEYSFMLCTGPDKAYFCFSFISYFSLDLKARPQSSIAFYMKICPLSFTEKIPQNVSFIMKFIRQAIALHHPLKIQQIEFNEKFITFVKCCFEFWWSKCLFVHKQLHKDLLEFLKYVGQIQKSTA